MAKFTWTAQDGQNKAQKGEMSAASREEVFTALARKGYHTIAVEEKTGLQLGKKRQKKLPKKTLLSLPASSQPFSTPVFRLFKALISCQSRLKTNPLAQLSARSRPTLQPAPRFPMR
jgi:hypothetical protein